MKTTYKECFYRQNQDNYRMMQDQLSQKILLVIADKIQSHPEVRDHHHHEFPEQFQIQYCHVEHKIR